MKNEWITKKDMAYWIIILVYTCIIILTTRLADNATAIDYFGFAGTLSSIILAVITIIYSFYQNSSNVVSTQKLLDSVNTIGLVTDELKKVSNIAETICSIEENVKQNIEVTKDIGNMLQTTADQTTNDEFNIKRETMVKSIKSYSYIQRSFLLYLVKVYESTKPNNMKNFLQYYTKDMDK